MSKQSFIKQPIVSNDVLFQIVAQRCSDKEPINTIIEKFLNARQYLACRQKEQEGNNNFVIEPDEAINEENITCCICGKKFDNLTRAHLFEHGLTMDEYRSLCGYPHDLKLFSGRYARKQEEKAKRMRKN